jgi:hypothetical protein
MNGDKTHRPEVQDIDAVNELYLFQKEALQKTCDTTHLRTRTEQQILIVSAKNKR